METNSFNTPGFVFTLLMVAALFAAPRRFAVLPIVAGACFVTLGQSVLIGSLHFYLMRILIVAGWARALIRSEARLGKVTQLDKAMLLWVLASVTVYLAREQTMEAFINRSGFAFDTLGLYFLFRFLVRDYGDVVRICKMLALLVIPLAVSMLIEKATGRNFFSLFGAVSEFSTVRDGRIRCQGSFLHAILAGTFGVTTCMLLVGLLFQGRQARLLSIVGLVSTMVIIITSASSGPLLALIFGLLALALFKIRRHLGIVRLGALTGVIGLHLVMNAPVWYIFDRISSITGGTGWYRGELINSFVLYFNEWWLAGTSYTAHWMPFALTPTMVDITNYYIRNGVDGGLLSLVLFLAMLAGAFRILGRTLHSLGTEQRAEMLLVWALGVALFAHLVSFISVSYFDQIVVFWYLLLAMVSLVGTLQLARSEAQERSGGPAPAARGWWPAPNPGLSWIAAREGSGGKQR